MAIGRISGPLLSKNLLRDGIDLAFETDLLYLDVTNGRIGIKKTAPAYELDVAGTVNAQSLQVLYSGPGTGDALIGKLVFTDGSISSNAGDVTIAAASNQVNIVGNTTVTGNIHATGNISADGDIILGSTGTDTVVFDSVIKSNVIPSDDSTYSIGSTERAWLDAYVQNLITSNINNAGGNISVNPGGGLFQINSDISVKGKNPIGTAPVVTNVLFVTMDGNDTNDGRAEDPSRACNSITAALRSPYYRPGTLIRVRSGHYLETNPLQLLPNTAIVGDDLRTTSIEPINKTRDLFHLQSGCYLAQMQFFNGRSGILPGPYASGSNRGAYCTSFPPSFNGSVIDVYQSPYIQNCTNQSGPWLIDGTLFVPNQTIQLPSAVATTSFSANTSTIIVTISDGTIVPGMQVVSGPQDPGYFNARTLLLANQLFIQDQVIAYVNLNFPSLVYEQAKCSRDVGLIVQNIAYDATFGGNEKSVESGLAYWNGVINLIEGQQSFTIPAIEYIGTLSQYIINNLTAPVLTTGTTYTQTINTALVGGGIAADEITAGINIITTIINSGTNFAPTIFNSCGPEAPLVSAELLLQANRTFFQEEVTAYVDAQYPNFTYKKDFCYRDVGLIVDAVSQDIVLGGNAKSLQCALSYFTGGKGDSSIAAQSLMDNMEIIQSILNSPDNAPEVVSGPNMGTGYVNAKTILLQNTLFIQNEVSAYVRSLFNNTFRLNQSQQNLCFRDIGLILNAIAEDAAAGGNANSVYAALKYYSGTTNILPARQLAETIQMLNYMLTICLNVINNVVSTNLYQNVYSQVTNLLPATNVEIDIISSNIDIITDIVTNGPSVAPALVPISLTMTTDINAINAFNVLTANKNFLAAEVTSYIDDVFGNGFTYNPDKCSRDTGLIVDSLAFDILYQGNSQATFTGLQYWGPGVSEIPNEVTTTTNAINYAASLAASIIVNASINRLQTATSQVFILSQPGSVNAVSTVTSLFNTVTNILMNGPVGIVNTIIPNSNVTLDTGIIHAYNLIQANKSFIEDEVIAYIDSSTANTSPAFIYNSDKCSRDISLIINSLAQDLVFGGNSQSTFSGLQYWNQGSTNIPGEVTTTTSAISYVRDLAMKIATNDVSGTRYQSAVGQITSSASATSAETAIIANEFNLILNIIANGTAGITDSIISNSLAESTNVDVQAAYALLRSNEAYIQAEAVAFVEATKTPSFLYNQTKCARDIGYIIDSISFDLLYGGNKQAIQSGVYYFGFSNTSSVVATEQTQVIKAYSYIKELVSNIIVGTRVPTQYQSSTSQVVSTAKGTPAEVNNVTSNIDYIISLINSSSEKNILAPIGIEKSKSVSEINAANLLISNIDFIKAEVIAYIDIMASAYMYDNTKCARDVGVIIDALAQDLLFGGTSQSTFSGLQYWSQGPSVIPNEVTTTTNAIGYIQDLAIRVITNDVSGIRFQKDVTQYIGTAGTVAESQIIFDEFNLIIDLITNGTLGITDKIIPNGITARNNTNVKNAYSLLQANKLYIQAETIAYIESIKSTGFAYDQTKCARDVIYMIDSVSFDLLYGGNRQAIQSGAYYCGFSTTSNAVSNEKPQVTAAYNYIKTISSYIVTGTRLPTQYQYDISQVITANTGTSAELSIINSEIDNIVNIIVNGPSVAASPTSIGLTISTTPSVVNAATLLESNREFIKAEVIAYINSIYPVGFQYNRRTCRRDIGYIIDSVSFDLLHGGNRQSIQSGAYYHGFDPKSNVLTYEVTQAIAAYNHISVIAKSIIKGIGITPTIGNTSTQVITGSAATDVEADFIVNDINIITDIINNGPAASYVKTPIGLTASTSTAVQNSYSLLLANREFIKAEVLAYIDYNFTNKFVFDKIKCTRDTGIIIDSVALDLLYKGTSQSIFSALQYWAQGTSVIPGELSTTTNAIEYSQFLAQNAISTTEEKATVGTLFSTIINIIDTGTVGVTDLIVPNGLPSVSPSIQAAYQALISATSSIQTNTISYINANNPGFAYDQSKCSRDIAYIINCVAFDLLHGGNRQSIQAGVCYFGFSSDTSNIINEIPQTTAAYNFLKNAIKNVAQNIPVPRLYQIASPQIIINSYKGLTNAIEGEQTITLDAINYLKNLSTNVISNTPVPIVRSATSQIFNSLFAGGIHANVPVSRNYDIISNILVNGPGAAPVEFTGSGFFATTGISSDDVRQSSVVLTVTSLGGSDYSITLNTPTVGNVSNGTLYFGNTAVFPLQDVDVPDTWAGRRVDSQGSMGGSLVDGGVVSARSPITSFVYDAFTQVNQGGRGIHITNNGYAQLVSVFTIFCSTAIQVDNGGICSITNSNSNFGDQCLVAKGYGQREFSGTVYNPPFPTYQVNGQYYPQGYYPKSGFVEVFIPDTKNRPHISLIMEVEPPLGHTNEQGLPGFLNAAPNMETLTTGSITITGIDTTGINVGDVLYIRDQLGNTNYVTTGTVVVDIDYQSITLNKSLINGGKDPVIANNTFFFTLYFCGKAYYTVLSSTLTDSHSTAATVFPSAQIGPEVSAISFIQSELDSIFSATGVNSESVNFLDDRFSIISNIISAATLVDAEAIIPNPTKLGTPPAGASLAITTINNNVEAIVASVLNYVETNFPDIAYPPIYSGLDMYLSNKCARDVRLILTQLVYDLETGGNYHAVFSGLSYWVREGTHHIINLEEYVSNNALFPDGATVNFYQRSYMSASGYLFEYVGAGANYGALPQRGIADPVQSKEVIQLNNGKVFFTSTDQNGDFRIGPGLVVSQATGILSGRTFTKSLFANLTPFILAIESGG